MRKPKFVYVLVSVYALVMVALLLVSCGDVSRKVSNITGYSRQCVDGVEYLQFISGVTIAYTPDGRIKTCVSK